MTRHTGVGGRIEEQTESMDELGEVPMKKENKRW